VFRWHEDRIQSNSDEHGEIADYSEDPVEFAGGDADLTSRKGSNALFGRPDFESGELGWRRP
jgi:hypothetical protein